MDELQGMICKHCSARATWAVARLDTAGDGDADLFCERHLEQWSMLIYERTKHRKPDQLDNATAQGA